MAKSLPQATATRRCTRQAYDTLWDLGLLPGSPMRTGRLVRSHGKDTEDCGKIEMSLTCV